MAVSSEARVATRYTLEFIERSLPPGARRVLEIGCGAGELASALAVKGLEVLAFDSDESCVAAARERGVDSRQAEWPAGVDRQFDAILFTRSLHHIHHLDGAIEAAVDALRPGGRIIVEDFRAEGASERSRCWARGLVALLADAGAFRQAEAAKWLGDKIEPSDPHGHELHSSAAIAKALARRGQVEQEPAAYYFRYFEPELPEATTASLLRHELELIEAGAIDPLGRRYTLSPER